jgi:Family of unknown function (DUF5678)
MAEQTERLLEFDPLQSHPGLSAPGHRTRELEWRRTHREVLRNFAGQWVVLEGEEIVTHGKDPQQVVIEARAKGIQVPYIFHVGEPTNVSPVTLEW